MPAWPGRRNGYDFIRTWTHPNDPVVHTWTSKSSQWLQLFDMHRKAQTKTINQLSLVWIRRFCKEPLNQAKPQVANHLLIRCFMEVQTPTFTGPNLHWGCSKESLKAQECLPNDPPRGVVPQGSWWLTSWVMKPIPAIYPHCCLVRTKWATKKNLSYFPLY